MRTRAPEPEIGREADRIPVLRDPVAEKLAHWMDEAISVGRFSIGLDALLGLVPAFGDIAGALIGMVIVLRAVQAGIPRVAIARMVTNIAIDTFVGAIPLLGDAFDFVYKSNSKNLRIYQDALRRGRKANARHWAFFLAVFAVIAAVAGLAVAGLIGLIHTLSHAL